MTSQKEDAVFPLARNAVTTQYEDLSPETVEITKRSILDTVGVILAAAGMSKPSKTVVDLVKEGGGNPESNIFGFGGRVPCWMAAYANGAMAQALDYDDVYDEGRNHNSGATLPAIFAVAERMGNVSGKEFITAAALGIDITARMSISVCESKEGYEDDWFLTPLFGAYGSALGAGKILGLNEEQIVNALGIVLNQAAGSMEMSFQPGAQVRELYSAFPGFNGVMSALWAQRGLTGVRNCLESRGGLFKMYFKGHYDRDRLLHRIGERFEGTLTSFKPWPSCRLSQCHIDAAYNLVTKHDIIPEDISKIIVHVCDSTKTLMEPDQDRRRPKFATHAKRSIPYTIGVILARRKLMIGDFGESALKDSSVLRLVDKVEMIYDQSLFTPGIPPAVVDIITNSGNKYTWRTEHAYGHPANPLSREGLIEKFYDCLSFSVKKFNKTTSQKLSKILMNLEDVDNMNQVIRMLV